MFLLPSYAITNLTGYKLADAIEQEDHGIRDSLQRLSSLTIVHQPAFRYAMLLSRWYPTRRFVLRCALVGTSTATPCLKTNSPPRYPAITNPTTGN